MSWQVARGLVRAELIRDDRRISWKNLRDDVQWRVFKPFLAAAGSLHGVLLTLSIDKRFAPEFIVGPGLRMNEFEDLSRFGDWKVSTMIKAGWIVHTAAILVAGFAAEGQDLYWMIDEDEIVETRERRQVISDSFRDVISDYLDFNMGGFEILTPEDDPNTMTVEDLLSIADLAAGAWADGFTTIRPADDREDLRDLIEGRNERMKRKAELITEWCSQNTHRNLKYMNIALSPGDENMPVYAMFVYPKGAGNSA